MNCEGYTKLSASILTSTVWVESDQTLRTWITLLALCDRNGFVSGTVPGLANVARVTVESCREAITKFLSPDIDSRTKEHEGRRIAAVDGGWLILNHAKYRDERDPDSRREQTRRAVAKHRQATKQECKPECKPCKPDVSPCKPKQKQKQKQKHNQNQYLGSIVSLAAIRQRLNLLYRRDTGSAWTYSEEHDLVDILKRPELIDELAELEASHQRNPGFFPRKLSTLLGDWPGALDNARQPQYARHGNKIIPLNDPKAVNGF